MSPLSVTLTLDLPQQMFQMAHPIMMENNCAKLYWKPLVNVGVMLWTISIYADFKILPWSVNLTLDLPKHVLQMAHLVIKENKFAESFSNPFPNVGV